MKMLCTLLLLLGTPLATDEVRNVQPKNLGTKVQKVLEKLKTHGKGYNKKIGNLTSDQTIAAGVRVAFRIPYRNFRVKGKRGYRMERVDLSDETGYVEGFDRVNQRWVVHVKNAAETSWFRASDLIAKKDRTISGLVSEVLRIGEHVAQLRYGLEDLRMLRGRLEKLRVLYDHKQWKHVIEDLENISKCWKAFESDKDFSYEEAFLCAKLKALPRANYKKWKCNVGGQLSSISAAAGPGKPGVKKSLQNPMGDEPATKPAKPQPVMTRHNTYRPTKPQTDRPSTNRPTKPLVISRSSSSTNRPTTPPVVRSSTPRPAKPVVVKKYSSYERDDWEDAMDEMYGR